MKNEQSGGVSVISGAYPVQFKDGMLNKVLGVAGAFLQTPQKFIDSVSQ